MPRKPRALGVAAALTAAAGVLAACQKPVPGVTVLSGSTTSILQPSRYCFDAAATKCRTSDAMGTVHATSNGTLLIDVPRAVADNHWLVAAYRRTAAGKSTPMDGYGSPAPISDRHSVRLPVPFGAGDYYLTVFEIEGVKQVGQWTAFVQVTS